MPDNEGRLARVRILHVTHELSLTGGPRLALETLRALGATVEVYTISGSGGGLETDFRRLGPVRILRRIPTRWHGGRHHAESLVAKGFGRLQAPVIGMLARAWRPDVLYINSVAAITLVPRLRLPRLTTVLHVHELGAALDRLSASHRDFLVTLPDRYVAVSSAVAEELVERRDILPTQVSVIPPVVDVRRIDAMAGERSVALDGSGSAEPLVVGGAGNPHWTKGIEYWLLMARGLVDQLGAASVRFEWVGVRENDAAVNFRAMIQKLDLESNVRLIGEARNPYEQFRRFDVFAMTSWEESASLVVLECMALGIPVVCFRGSGGPPEQVGDTGIVLDDFSPRAMADSIADLIRDSERRAEIGMRERERVLTANAPSRISGLLRDEFLTRSGRHPKK